MTSKTTATDKGQTDNQNADAMTAEEIKQLKSCEASIRLGLKSYQNVGKALTMISQGRLYRSTHSTFATYCRSKWDMTTARASQLQHAYRVNLLLTAHDFKVLPQTESQCRPLARIPSDENMDSLTIAAWQAVVDSKENITAKLISDAVDTVLGIEPKQAKSDEHTTSIGGNHDTAGDAHGTTSASAEMRAEMRALKQKIAYLESALEAEKQAHKRTASQGGLPTSAMAKKLFKAGFRAMAKVCHPEQGGSEAAMAELNSLKATLLP